MKLLTQIGLTYLKPRNANWAYKKKEAVSINQSFEKYQKSDHSDKYKPVLR